MCVCVWLFVLPQLLPSPSDPIRRLPFSHTSSVSLPAALNNSLHSIVRSLTESHSNPPTLSPAGHRHHHHHPYPRPPGCCSERRCKGRPLVVVVADGAGAGGVPARLSHVNRTLVESVTGRSDRRCREVMKRHLSGLPARHMRARSFSSHPLEGGSCTAACAETKAQRPRRRSRTNEAAS